MNLYEAEEDDFRGGQQKAAKGQPHVFEFNRTLWRMVCAKCGGKMNECPVICKGK